MIDLSLANTAKSADLKTGKLHTFEIATNNNFIYYLQAETEQEKDDWIGAIGKAIVQSSRAYIKEDDERGFHSYDEDD